MYIAIFNASIIVPVPVFVNLVFFVLGSSLLRYPVLSSMDGNKDESYREQELVGTSVQNS